MPSFYSVGFLAHALFLISILLFRRSGGIRYRAADICATFLLLWADLVCTGLALSPTASLGNLPAYLGVSVAIAVVMAISRNYLDGTGSMPESATGMAQDPSRPIATTLLSIAIIAVILPTVAICYFYEPNNFDSVAERIPKALLYLGQGSVMPPDTGDFRITSYPFDIALVYVWPALFGLGGPWFNLFSVATWLVGGIAVHQFARDIGASRTAALFSATLFLTAPAVLISASSTNDDLIAGVPLLIGAMFICRWWKSGATTDVLLGAIGLGLSAGSKLHLPFFVPFAAMLTCALALELRSQGKLREFLKNRAAQIVLGCLIAPVLFVPIFIMNWIRIGHLTPQLPNFQNSPFSLTIAAINSAIYSAQLFLSPIPDLYFSPSQLDRRHVYDTFNRFLNDHVFYWVKPDLNYSNSPYYFFRGVTAPDAHLGDQSAWLGFVPWLLVLTIVVGIRIGGRRGKFAAWLACAFFLWHLARCFLLKYVETAGIYYAYPIAMTAPALALLWDGASKFGKLGNWLLRVACVGVLIANLISAANTFSFNNQRNIPALIASGFHPSHYSDSQKFASYLKASNRTFITYSRWELPYLQFMGEQRKARYFTGLTLPASPSPDYDLSIVTAREIADYGELPIKIENDDRRRLTELGGFETIYGKERAFGSSPHLFDRPKSSQRTALFDYAPTTDDASLFASGWSYPEGTHRWSDGPESTLRFSVPHGAENCTISVTAITAGPEQVAVSLNGHSLAAIPIKAWFPGVPFQISLPNDYLTQGEPNSLRLGFDRTSEAGGRHLALGITHIALACDTPPDGHDSILLNVMEDRDGAGGLKSFWLGRVFGIDQDEAFVASADLVDASGGVAHLLSDAALGAPSASVAVPGAPKGGWLRIHVQRRDRPEIEGTAFLPVKSGETINPDIDKPPSLHTASQ
jgi:hypothetical protein